jgi:hypothetical protein
MRAMPESRSIDDLQSRLMDTRDVRERARIHLELGRIALSDGRLEVAVRHLREALVLDHRLEQARKLLQDLGQASRVQISKAGGRRKAMRVLLGRLRRRSGPAE